MPGRRCAIYGCNNSRYSTKMGNPEIAYHNFPKKKYFDTIRNEWIRRCERTDNWNPNTSQICSVHFAENDYERDMRNEILGLPLRRILKKSALPTLHLPNNSRNITSLQTQMYQKGNETEGLQRRKELSKLIVSQNAPINSTTSLELNKPVLDEVKICNKPEPNLQLEYRKLLQNYNALKSKMCIMKRKLYLQHKQLQYYKSRNKRRKISPKNETANIHQKSIQESILIQIYR